MVFGEVAGRPIKPGRRPLGRRVQNGQPAKGLLHHIFGPLAPPPEPNRQWNGVPFDQRDDLFGGQRHATGLVGSGRLSNKTAPPPFFCTIFEKKREKRSKRLGGRARRATEGRFARFNPQNCLAPRAESQFTRRINQGLFADGLIITSKDRSAPTLRADHVSKLFPNRSSRLIESAKLNQVRTLPIDRSILAPPSAALLKFVRERAVAKSTAAELRRSKRYAAVLEVVVVPLNEQFRPAGLPFLAVTRDVSTAGLCMLHTRPAPSTKLFVEIERPNEAPLDVVVNIRRNRRAGQFFEMAGDFITVEESVLAAAKARVGSRSTDQPG